jgi:hypothetical protein
MANGEVRMTNGVCWASDTRGMATKRHENFSCLVVPFLWLPTAFCRPAFASNRSKHFCPRMAQMDGRRAVSAVICTANRQNLRVLPRILTTTNHTNCTNVGRVFTPIRGIRPIRGFQLWFRPTAGLGNLRTKYGRSAPPRRIVAELRCPTGWTRGAVSPRRRFYPRLGETRPRGGARSALAVVDLRSGCLTAATG